MAQSSQPTLVACPNCGRSVEWGPQSPYRPFCSERCKTIDLGAWASEQYRVPVVEDKDQPDDAAAPGKPPAEN
jgi:endogenous inhibitor of DNA gyrase (YacG/DUF329 family)